MTSREDRCAVLRWGAAKREARLAAKVGHFSPKAQEWSREYDRLHPKPEMEV